MKQKAEVKLKLSSRKVINVVGEIKEMRKVYGRSELLITNGQAEDFWTSKAKLTK